MRTSPALSPTLSPVLIAINPVLADEVSVTIETLPDGPLVLIPPLITTFPDTPPRDVPANIDTEPPLSPCPPIKAREPPSVALPPLKIIPLPVEVSLSPATT